MKDKETGEIIHGIPSSYTNDKCHCDDCKAAWRDYMKPRVAKYRARKKKEKENGTE